MTEPRQPSFRTVGSHQSATVVEVDVVGSGGLSIVMQVRPAAGDIPVMLIHGFGSSGRANWSATGWLTSLERAGLPTITVDLRGHGLSGKPHDATSYSLSVILEDLRNALGALPDVLGPVPVVDLVGYSMGGRLAGELVAASTSSPRYRERTPWESGLPSVRRSVIGGYDGRPLFDTVEFADFVDALAGTSGPDSRGRRIAGIAQAGRGNDLVALSAMVKGLSAARTSLPAQAVEVPTLVVAGERDAITDNTLRWAEGLPQGRHLVLSGRDHISAVTSASFRSAAVEFLTGSFPGLERPVQDPSRSQSQ